MHVPTACTSRDCDSQFTQLQIKAPGIPALISTCSKSSCSITIIQYVHT
jgi:hypothetical protein